MHKKDKKGRVVKVAVILWTIDPENQIRFLMRHSKPFNGYDDEWTVSFGSVDPEESEILAAKREAEEEFGIREFDGDTLDLNYSTDYSGKHGPTVVHFFAMKVPNIDVKIVLNEESIGYDWMLVEKVMETMVHDDEKKAFNLLLKKIHVLKGD